MKTIVIIPSRMGASRFPGKPLHPILGVPLLGHCIHRARMAHGLEKIVVATCDKEIFDFANSLDCRAIMTSDKHQRATDRTAEALLKLETEENESYEAVIMVQGDEPLLSPKTINSVSKKLADDGVLIVNMISRFASKEAFLDRNNVKVVADKMGKALYFSREPIPSPWREFDTNFAFNQVGVIGFKKEALFHFNSISETRLERFESIDMNRVLENGGRIDLVLTEAKMLGVDTLDEAAAAAALLKDDELFESYARK